MRDPRRTKENSGSTVLGCTHSFFLIHRVDVASLQTRILRCRVHDGGIDAVAEPEWTVHLLRGLLELLRLHRLQLLVVRHLLWCPPLLLSLLGLLGRHVHVLGLVIRQRLLCALLHRLSLRLGLHKLVVLRLLLLRRHGRTVGRCWTGRLRWRVDELLLLLRRHGAYHRVWLSLTRSARVTGRTGGRWPVHRWTHCRLVRGRHDTRWRLLHHVG